MDHIQNTVSVSGSEIIDINTASCRQFCKCFHMAAGQIHNMNIIAYTGAVRRVIVISEDADLRQLADCNLRNIRQQIVRNPLRILTDHTALMCADRIEVAKQHNIPLIVRSVNVRQNLLEHGLRPSIRIRADTLRAALRDRNLRRISVNGSRRTEDNIFYAVIPHLITKCQRSADVVLIVLDRLRDRLSDRLQACEMNDCINLLLIKHCLNTGPITDIRLVEGHFLPCDLLNPVHSLSAGIIQIVKNDHLMPFV